MNKNLLPASLLLLTVIFFSGCIKDKCRRTESYTMYVPVYKTTLEVRANIKSNTSQELERPGKLFIKGSYIYLNELDKGVHIIDNTNPANPRNVAFINIPGNMDLAVKGDMLYADMYTDLVAIDISNPLDAKLRKVVEGVFPHRYYHSSFRANAAEVIVDWQQRDTTLTVDCNSEGTMWASREMLAFSSKSTGAGASAASPFGMGGSMARFSVVQNRLYSVTYSDLNVFNISQAQDPSFVKKTSIGWQIETIYPFKNNLFIGSANGMYIYNINDADNPKLSGKFGHVASCDPVIADDTHAYVTLRSGTACQGFTNQLEVLRLNGITDPSLVKTYSMTNPHGLAKDGNLLFICDGADGLKMLNAASIQNIHLLKKIGGFNAYDVLLWNKIAIVSAQDGLYQFDYSDPANLHLVSKMNFIK